MCDYGIQQYIHTSETSTCEDKKTTATFFFMIATKAGLHSGFFCIHTYMYLSLYLFLYRDIWLIHVCA